MEVAARSTLLTLPLSKMLEWTGWQGCAGRPFIPRGGAKVKIHGAGRGEGENPRGGAKKRANQPIQKIYKSAKNIILHIIILIIKLKSKNRLSFCFIFKSMYYYHCGGCTMCTSLLQYICRGNALKTLLTDVRIELELRAV